MHCCMQLQHTSKRRGTARSSRITGCSAERATRNARTGARVQDVSIQTFFEIVGTKLMVVTWALPVRAAANAQGSTSVMNSDSCCGVRGANLPCFEHIQEGCWDCGDLNHYKGNPACHYPTGSTSRGSSLFLSKGQRGGGCQNALALMAAVIVYCFSNCTNTDSRSCEESAQTISIDERVRQNLVSMPFDQRMIATFRM